MAVLPGKDLLQPLATATGLVRSAASARAEVSTSTESANGKRRRGGRGRSPVSTDTPVLEEGLESGVSGESSSEATEPAPVTRRQDPELVAVPMDEEQERVYGWLGLNPVLLLDPPPSQDNLLVRVVRPGEDAEAVLEEARQQMAASSGRRRRRGARGSRGAGKSVNGPAVAPPTSELDVQASPVMESPLLVEITPLEVAPLPEAAAPPALPDAETSPVEALEAPPSTGADERPGRRRRRSSATAG